VSTRFQAIVEAIVTALEGIDGAGDYVHDLSGDGAVIVGDFQAVPDPPFVQIPSISWSSAFDGAPLTQYARQLIVGLYGFVASSDGTMEARTYSSFDLLNDITLALEADPTLGGLVISMIVQAGAAGFDGPEDLAGLAGVYVEVVCTLHRRTGV
jgi:hypothetical protein